MELLILFNNVKIAFGVGAFIMCLPFYYLGIKDYHMISIYACLIILPLICNLDFLYTTIRIKSNLLRILYALIFIVSIGISFYIYDRYIGPYGFENIEQNKMAIFNLCKKDLLLWAKYLHTDYNTVNVVVYMFIFPMILISNFIIRIFDRKKK